MNLRLCALGCSVVGLGICACDGAKTPTESAPISHASAALQVEANTERALRGAIDSSGHLAHSKALVRLLSSFGGSSTSCSASSSPTIPETCTASGDCTVSSTVSPIEETCVTESNDVTEEDLEEAKSELHEAVDDLLSSLREEVFIDENLESDDGNTVVYKLGPKLLCNNASSSVPEDTAPSTATPEAVGTETSAPTTTAADPSYDPECLVDVEKWAPRLQLVSPREGDVDVSLLLTDQRISPISLGVYRNKLSLTADLGKFEAAANRAGKPLEAVTGLAGIISASLTENGSLNYTFDLSVTSMVKMILGDQPDKISISLAPSPKALSLNVDGNSGRISGQLDVSSFQVLAPLAAFMAESDDDVAGVTDGTNGLVATDPSPTSTEKTYHGNIEGYLAGLSGNFSYEQSSDVIALTNIGFGSEPSYVKFDQSTLLSIDVNAQKGRVFDLYVDGRSDVGPSLQFSSGLDVDLLLGFAAIADQVTDIEQYFLNDKLKLSLTGDKPAISIEDEQVRVVSGSLQLSSELNGSYRTVVEAGMCLVNAEPEVTPVSLAGELTSSTCK